MSTGDVDLPGPFVVPEWFENHPWQSEGTSFAVQNKRVLIPLPTGSGKTFIALKMAHELKAQRVLVLCSKSSLYVWYKNFKTHLPEMFKGLRVIDKLNGPSRKEVYQDPTITVLVMKVKTYLYDHTFIHSLACYDMVIADECHKYMRKHDTIQYKKLKQLFVRTPFVVWMSATPVSKGRQEIWPLLHVARPNLFKSYWHFINDFVMTVKNFGLEYIGPKNTERFRKAVGSIVYMPSMPITGIPLIRRSTIPVVMDSPVARKYKELMDDMYVSLSEGILMASTTVAKVTRLRQLLCCPAILDRQLGYGAGIEAILDHMEEGDGNDSRRHCVWFTPFTGAIPYILGALSTNNYKEVVVFRGGMDFKELKENEIQFRDRPDCVAVCSIKFAESFELETGYPAYFLGYDFDPYVNAQGEGRLARLTSKREFLPSYYIHHLGTYEDRMLEICGDKVSNTRVDMVKVSEVKDLFALKIPEKSP